MALRRMVPVNFFKDPDIMNLKSRETQLMLLGLILAADDEGRAVAHAGLLGREMDYPAEQIEEALHELVANDLLVLYQAGKHRYYQLTRWDQWQTLGNKKTPSKLPAPPQTEEGDTHLPEILWKNPKNSGKIRTSSPQLNQRESNRIEDEGEAKDPPDRDQPGQPQNVVPFPTSRASDTNADGTQRKADGMPEAERAALVQQVACILKLPVTDALARLVAEYTTVASLSLPGEADAAREWIDDSRRNRKRKQMSPAFFRNWLKREQEAVDRRQQALQALATLPTGTAGNGNMPSHAPSTPGPPASRPPDLMHLADEDQQAERTKGVKH